MENYVYKDIISAFEFAKTNHSSSVENWVEYNSNHISEKEIELYKHAEFVKFKIELNKKKYEFLLIRFNSQSITLLSNLTNKILGNKEYYQLSPMPGEWYPPIHIIIGFDTEFFTLHWKDDEKFPGVKIAGNKNIRFTYEMIEDVEDFDFYSYGDYKRDLEKNNICFWDGESTLMAFIKSTKNFKFKPIKELFKNV